MTAVGTTMSEETTQKLFQHTQDRFAGPVSLNQSLRAEMPTHFARSSQEGIDDP